MEKECKHCHKIIHYDKPQQLGRHISNCPSNPNLSLTRQKQTEGRIKFLRAKNPLLKIVLNCLFCNKEFNIEVVKSAYNRGYYTKCCSKECAHKYSSKIAIEKTRNKTKVEHCKHCGNEVIVAYRAGKNVSCPDCTKRNRTFYKNGGSNYCRICGQSICGRPKICRDLKSKLSAFYKFNINTTTIGTTAIYDEYDKIINMLRKEYYDNEKTLVEIGLEHNINHQTLSFLFKKWKIFTRNNSESQFNALKHGKRVMHEVRSNIYKTGWHTTWNSKIFYYRSSYELDYYKKLDAERVIYEVENLRIIYFDTKLKRRRISIPDINIPHNNEIIEIKSPWTLDKLNMQDKIKAYKKLGYNVRIIIGKGRHSLFENYDEEIY